MKSSIGICLKVKVGKKKKKLHIVVKNYEKQYITKVLNRWGWNKIKTAKALGIGLSSLYRKIKELEIERK